MKNCKLASGFEVPILGLGTWELTGKTCYEAVRKALDIGYTHIDTAVAYENEKEVGKAVGDSDVERSRLFITTKTWMTSMSYADAIRQCDDSLKNLGTGYLDLLLIHWPDKSVKMEETLRAYEKLISDGKVRSIGVSNFSAKNLLKALGATSAPISMNQVEFHPRLYQKDLHELCKAKKVVLTAYSPLGRGKYLGDPPIIEIGKKHGVSPSQVILSWLMAKGIVAIPKATSEDHLRDNLKAAELQLTKEESGRMDKLNRDERLIIPPWADF